MSFPRNALIKSYPSSSFPTHPMKPHFKPRLEKVKVVFIGDPPAIRVCYVEENELIIAVIYPNRNIFH